MVGCDLHDRSMFLKYAVDPQEPLQATYVNDVKGRLKMILELKEFAKKHKSKRIVLVYEASGLGFGLCDQLHDEGAPWGQPQTPGFTALHANELTDLRTNPRKIE